MSTAKEISAKNQHLNAIMDTLSSMIRQEIDNELLKEILGVSLKPYTHIKTFVNSNGETRHLIEYNAEVWEWLITEHPSFGQKNPEWTLVRDNKINISDKLYVLLKLRWSTNDT